MTAKTCACLDPEVVPVVVVLCDEVVRDIAVPKGGRMLVSRIVRKYSQSPLPIRHA